MKITITIIFAFVICWGLIFWLGCSRLDNGYDYIPAQYNLKGALISLAATIAVFGIDFLIAFM